MNEEYEIKPWELEDGRTLPPAPIQLAPDPKDVPIHNPPPRRRRPIPELKKSRPMTPWEIAEMERVNRNIALDAKHGPLTGGHPLNMPLFRSSDPRRAHNRWSKAAGEGYAGAPIGLAKLGYGLATDWDNTSSQVADTMTNPDTWTNMAKDAAFMNGLESAGGFYGGSAFVTPPVLKGVTAGARLPVFDPFKVAYNKARGRVPAYRVERPGGHDFAKHGADLDAMRAHNQARKTGDGWKPGDLDDVVRDFNQRGVFATQDLGIVPHYRKALGPGSTTYRTFVNPEKYADMSKHAARNPDDFMLKTNTQGHLQNMPDAKFNKLVEGKSGVRYGDVEGAAPPKGPLPGSKAAKEKWGATGRHHDVGWAKTEGKFRKHANNPQYQEMWDNAAKAQYGNTFLTTDPAAVKKMKWDKVNPRTGLR